MKAEVKLYCGNPTIFLDEVPCSGLMHWTKSPTEADAALFRDADVHFYSFMGNLSVPPPAGTPAQECEIHDGGLPRLLLTEENIDQLMTMLVNTDPAIRILPRIIMNPPVWWEKCNPDELMLFYYFESGKYHRGPRASLASAKWNTIWQKELRRTIRYFEKNWGDHIFGYHTGLGHCGEHVYQWWDTAADFNELNRAEFRNWLKLRYVSIAKLNQAWRSKLTDFEEVTLPEGKEFADFGPRANALFLPETEQRLIDFQLFSSESMADMLLLEARTVKNELAKLGSIKLHGAFYGYINLVANSTQSTVGHSALTRVLKSPDVDFLCGPLSYGARQNGGVTLPQMIPGSIILHGKVFYNEDDTGTHLFHGSHHGYLPTTAEESVQTERRNFLATWSAGGTLWWMDLYGKQWFLSPELQQEFARLHTFAENHLDDHASGAQIAVFVSLTSSLCMRDTPVPLTGNLIEQQLFEIASCGAPFDLFQDEDLPLLAAAGKLEQYKLCIFTNLLAPSAPVRAAIESALKNSDRTLLWFYMPGYFEANTRSEAASETLTGIHFSTVQNGIMPMLTEFWQNDLRMVYGLTRAVYPRFSADDPAATKRGYYVNGTTIAGQPHGSGAALVEKQFSNWKSVWSSSPGLPSLELGRLAEAAGVHLYTRRGDQIFRGRRWLGLHAKCTGPLTIALPERCCCRNAITGEEFPVSDRISLNLNRGETILFDLFQP